MLHKLLLQWWFLHLRLLQLLELLQFLIVSDRVDFDEFAFEETNKCGQVSGLASVATATGVERRIHGLMVLIVDGASVVDAAVSIDMMNWRHMELRVLNLANRHFVWR